MSKEQLLCCECKWWKQLAHKTQECEILQQSENEAKEIIAELEAENEQLKKQIESDKGLITATGKQNYQLIQEYDRLKTENEQIKYQIEVFTRQLENANKEAINEKQKGAAERQKNEKAEQKLELIRKIAEKDINFCSRCNRGKEIDCIDCIEGGRSLLAKEILRIIDEVGNE